MAVERTFDMYFSFKKNLQKKNNLHSHLHSRKMTVERTFDMYFSFCKIVPFDHGQELVEFLKSQDAIRSVNWL